jgi:hypothetical protein
VNSYCLLDWTPNDLGRSKLPFAVEATLAIGPRVAPITSDGQPNGETVNVARYKIRNQKGKLVRTDNFLNPEYANVSALLGCYHKPMVNPDYRTTGRISLTLVHNPLTAVPVAKGILGVEKENEYIAEREGDGYIVRPLSEEPTRPHPGMGRLSALFHSMRQKQSG